MCANKMAQNIAFAASPEYRVTEEYKTTVSSVIYQEFAFATTATFGLSEYEGYHFIEHTKACADTVDAIFSNIRDFPIDLEQQLKLYIQQNSLPNIDFNELYSLVKIAFLSHDLGNIAELEDWAKQLSESDIEQFLTKYEPNKGEKPVKNLQTGHSEINSEER